MRERERKNERKVNEKMKGKWMRERKRKESK